jgi:hypothetical protein
MYSNFVSLSVSLLYGGVVGVLVRDEESGLNVTAVRILPLAVEDLLVEGDIVVVDGIIEGDGDHLGNVLGGEVTGDPCAVLATETIWEYAHGGVAGWRPIRVVVIVC